MIANAERNVSGEDILNLTADIAAAFFSHNTVRQDEVTRVIRDIHQSLTRIHGGAPPPVPAATTNEKPKPAVPVSKSVGTDYIVCLEDGKRMKMLKRYLRAKYNLTPEEYRRRWNLPADYPMVAPAYAERRSHFAKQIGLGTGVRRGS